MRGVLPLVIASLTLTSLPAMAADWVRVKTNANNDIFSVDAASIEGRGNIRNFWSNVEFGKQRTVSGKRIFSALYYVSVDCRKNVYSVRFVQYLDQKSSLIQESNYGDRGGLVKPERGSSQEASMKFACSRK